jgi:hypothetical protein
MAVGHTGFTTNCCGPVADSNGNPTGPYICKPNDGKAYDCGTCTAGYCGVNLTGDAGSYGTICMEPCTNNTQCGSGGAQCVPLQTGSCNGSAHICQP